MIETLISMIIGFLVSFLRGILNDVRASWAERARGRAEAEADAAKARADALQEAITILAENRTPADAAARLDKGTF